METAATDGIMWKNQYVGILKQHHKTESKLRLGYKWVSASWTMILSIPPNKRQGGWETTKCEGNVCKSQSVKNRIEHLLLFLNLPSLKQTDLNQSLTEWQWKTSTTVQTYLRTHEWHCESLGVLLHTLKYSEIAMSYQLPGKVLADVRLSAS